MHASFDGISVIWTGDDMKTLLAASLTGLALLSGSALAADLPPAPMYKAPPPPAPAYSWSGCYLAGGFGYGMFNGDHYGETLPGNVPLTATLTSGGRGWLGRGGGGCDYQVGQVLGGNVILGVLADYDFMNIHGTVDSPVGIQGNEKISGTWYAGGRIGYAFTPNIMGFTSAGYTQAKASQVNFATAAAPIVGVGFDLPSTTYQGWFLGGGTEVSLAPWLPMGWFMRSEYRYSSYSAKDVPLVVTATGAATGVGTHVTPFVQTITTSIMYKFNWF
jgi:outer membrane immunogenic protein